MAVYVLKRSSSRGSNPSFDKAMASFKGDPLFAFKTVPSTTSMVSFIAGSVGVRASVVWLLPPTVTVCKHALSAVHYVAEKVRWVFIFYFLFYFHKQTGALVKGEDGRMGERACRSARIRCAGAVVAVGGSRRGHANRRLDICRC